MGRLRSSLRSSPVYRPYTALKYRVSSRAREDLFTGYFRDNVWGDPESASGAGSSLEQTARLRAELPGLLAQLQVRTLLDVPCGDFAWMQHVALPGVDYIGGDIVGELVERLQAEHGGAGRSFRRVDLVTDELPRADAVLVRDLFLHLPFEMTRRAVANVKRSGATWLLTSTYPQVLENADVRMADHRFPNLTLAPYGWPKPVQVVEERPSTQEDRNDKTLGVWRVSELP